MKKRGLGHVEVILSFVIFTGVALFALYFFNPSNSSRLVESSLTYAFRETISNTTSEILTFTIIVKNDSMLSADPNIEVLGIYTNNVNETLNVLAEDSGGELLQGKLIENKTYISASPEFWARTKILYLRFDEEFPEGNFDVPEEINESFYEISSSRIEKLISERKILDLNKTYHENYAGLKRAMNLPNRVNFGFSLAFSGGDLINAERETKNLEVFSDKKRVEALRADGKKEFAELIVKVW